MVGGGALPLCEIKSALICLKPEKMSASRIEEWLRSYDPPIICRVEKEKVLLDVRTIRDKELKVVAKAINEIQQKAN